MDCPDTDDAFETFLALLPRGRAWQSGASGTVTPAESVMKRFWRAVATPWAAAEQAICDAYLDLSCATAEGDLDLWLEDYGLPDACDPSGDDLCAKVRTVGGDSASYWTGVAAGIGIVADIRFLKGDPDDPDHPGVAATLYARIDTLASFAADRRPPFCGNWNLGVQRLGDPDASRFACMLDNALPAHLDAIVEFV